MILVLDAYTSYSDCFGPSIGNKAGPFVGVGLIEIQISGSICDSDNFGVCTVHGSKVAGCRVGAGVNDITTHQFMKFPLLYYFTGRKICHIIIVK